MLPSDQMVVAKCLGSEINWTRPRPISVSAESCTAGLVHALSTAPRPSEAGGAVGKGWGGPAPNWPIRAVCRAHAATSAGSAADGKCASSMTAFNFSRAALAQPCHFGRPTAFP